MLETELKAMLTLDEYNTIKNMFDWDSSKEQINSYYTDANGALKSNGITMRIRTKDGVNKIQIKKHLEKKSALQVSEETEYEIDSVCENFTSLEVFKMTGVSADVSLLGSLVTLRNSHIFCEGVEICLDKSRYLGVTDYEIEIEYTKEIPKQLLNMLSDIGIEFDKKTPGKYSRFINRLANIK